MTIQCRQPQLGLLLVDVYFHKGTNMKVDMCYLSACLTTIISDDILI